MTIRQQYARDFERLEALIRFTEVELKKPSHAFVPEYNPLFYLGVMSLWVKAVKTASSIVLLCENGFGSDANGLMRTLVETTITSRYLCLKDQNERALWYATYGAIQQKNLMGILTKGRYANIRAKIDPAHDAVLQDIYDETIKRRNSKAPAWKRFKMHVGLFVSRFGIMVRWWPWAQTWSGKSVPKMAAAVGLPTFYDLPYQLASPIVHATDPTNHIELLDPERTDISKGVRFLIGPDEKHIDNALLTATLALDELLRETYKVLQLPRRDEFEALSAANRADMK